MKEEFKLDVLDIFRMQTGHVFFVCQLEPIQHRLIKAGSDAVIIVEGILERKLNLLGESIFRSGKMCDKNRTVVTSADNVDDIVEFVGKKKIFIKGFYPDELESDKIYLFPSIK